MRTSYFLAAVALIGIALCIMALIALNNNIGLLDALVTIFVSIGLYTALEIIYKKHKSHD